jgi:hypothetical protein|mmetsp:Transcript_82064/g.137098  ORF Transcript_82064/g.137098 Transcript_82064/m.137098 type:complete len:91 (-) Transcript_82064:103-375(-)
MDVRAELLEISAIAFPFSIEEHLVASSQSRVEHLDSEDPKKGGGERGSISMMGVWLLLTDLPFVHFDSSLQKLRGSSFGAETLDPHFAVQ